MPDTFAEIVFDRPLDHAYSYAVPSDLLDRIGVGKRVLASFGRGDSGTIGYCVRIHEQDPGRAVKAITQVLDDEALLTEPLLRLTRWMADYYLCGWGQVLQAVLPAGVRDQAGTRQAVKVEVVEDLPEPLPKLTPKQAAALEALRAGGAMEQKRLFDAAGVGPGVVQALLAKGLVRSHRERVEKAEPESHPATPHAPLQLTREQAQAWLTVEASLVAAEFKAFLLHGVTGSGKTEIYLRAIEDCVKRGQQALVLVPEISLTPQTIERFRGRCGEVAVMHSHLSDAERGAHWRRIAAGHVNVVVGARSAVFAPVRRLGLICIDEEHENSFKQESTPRYHARDVAVMRAKLENIPILLGSATPALESWANAAKGQYHLLSLSSRVADRPMPHVTIVDMRHEQRTGGRFASIGHTLERSMREALGGGQVMLLLNRRGYSTHVHCPLCGFVANCPNCDLTLTFHRQRSCLLCHYCGHEQPPYRDCPSCAKPAIQYQGLGTEKLEAEIAQKFPNKKADRMDSDTMSRPGAHQRVLDAFRRGETDILLGTQMIAKGLDFPNVTLVGVVNADVGLHLPDFRAAERTFQLLAQVSGRTGRGDRGGRVVVQTYTPDHPSVVLAARHDYLTFAEAELKHRLVHAYPPYQRLARLIVRSKDQAAAGEFSETLAGAFREAMRKPERQAGLRLLGPAEAPIYRLNNYYRHHFQLQSASPRLLHDVLREVLTVVKTPHKVEYQVDIDPFNMM